MSPAKSFDFDYTDYCDILDNGITPCSSFTSNDADNCVYFWVFRCGPSSPYFQSGSYQPVGSPKCVGQCCDNNTFNAIKSQFNDAYKDAGIDTDCLDHVDDDGHHNDLF